MIPGATFLGAMIPGATFLGAMFLGVRSCRG